MPSISHADFPLLLLIIVNLVSEICGARIHSLEVPPIVRNGTGPIDLLCMYQITEDENGLVIKWFHDRNQIYRWIPPMPPQDVGVLNGLTEYPEENLRHPNSVSVIRLKTVTTEMTGEYTCTISTFQEENSANTNMIVYAPETDASIYVSSFNASHLNLTCVVNGAQPRPLIKFYIEGIETNNYYNEIVETEEGGSFVSRSAILSNILSPIVLDCEISIPPTDYKRRERIVYYPVQALPQTSNCTGYDVRFLDIVILICIMVNGFIVISTSY